MGKQIIIEISKYFSMLLGDTYYREQKLNGKECLKVFCQRCVYEYNLNREKHSRLKKEQMKGPWGRNLTGMF